MCVYVYVCVCVCVYVYDILFCVHVCVRLYVLCMRFPVLQYTSTPEASQ